MLENLSTPVLFIVFNRLDTTCKVFEAIRQARPTRLYIAADGPRENKPDEDLKIQAVRAYVMNHIDWKCEVKTLFREKNLGCKIAVSSAIDWFFENEEEGIIIEDDCLPDASFFPFCVQLLERYRHDDHIWMISGDNLYQGHKRSSNSYYFSQHCYIWGWATWARAWRHYDPNMRSWPQLRANGFLKTINPPERYYWQWSFDHVFSGRIDTWDYQWVFACRVNKGLAVIPAVNLVSNIGFGQDSTHTQQIDHRIADLKTHSLDFPLVHPESVVINAEDEELLMDGSYKMSALKYRWRMFKEMVGLK